MCPDAPFASSRTALWHTARAALVGAAGFGMGPAVPPPRPTYCSAVYYGLPGGCGSVDVELEGAWEWLVQRTGVRVSRHAMQSVIRSR